MPTKGQPLHVEVTGGNPNISIITGDHSAAQSGTGHTAHLEHTQGPDLALLGPLLQDIAGVIGELPSAKAREALAAHVRIAEAEAGKKDRPEPGVIKRALDAIKHGAEAIEGGEKIVELCRKAYQVLAPFLGISPLP